MIDNKPIYFTNHQLQRMANRGISKRIVNEVITNGIWKKGKKPSSFQVEYKGVIVILYEEDDAYKVTTCKLNREKTLEAEKLKEQLDIDFFKAVHKVVKSLGF